MKRLIDTANAPYQRRGNVKLGLIIVAVCVIALVIAAIFAVPKLVEMEQEDVYSSGKNDVTVTAIVPNDDGKIGVDADFSNVFVTVRYSDGSQAEVALSELIVSGLDVSESATLESVVLDYGGFQQTVTYEVLPTQKVVEYIASTGGRINGDSVQNVNAGSDASTVVAMPDEGYKFIEWSDGNPNATRTDTKVSVDQKLIASFKKISYTVVFFYPDGTTAREQTVLYDEAATKVPRTTEENMQLYGYRFTGWSESYDHITADTNIYPVYEKYATDVYIDYTLGIDGSALGSSDATAYYEKAQIAVIRVQANPEKLFTGWSIYTLKNGWKPVDISGDTETLEIGVEYNNITFVTARTSTSDEYTLTFTPTEDTEEIYIKANFVYKESTVSFSSMSTKVRQDILVPVGHSIGEYFDVEDLTTLSDIVGYTFLGWYKKNGSVKADGTPVLIKNSQTFDQPTTLIAYWQKDMYKVVFLLGDNEDTDFVNNEYYDAEYGGIVLDVMYQDPLAGAVNGSFPDKTPIKNNYTFVGWYLRGEGNVATDAVIDRTYKITDEVTYVLPVFTVNLQALTASITGSGSVSVVKNGTGTAEAVTGQYMMQAIYPYTVIIQAGDGYTISEVSVTNSGGTTVTNPSGDTYTLEISAPVLSYHQIKVEFKPDEFELKIVNGTTGTNGIKGTIVYQEIDDGALGTVTTSDVTITGIILSSGVTKHLWIYASDGNYINSIRINDVAVTDLPSQATAYTIVLEAVDKDLLIQINYAGFKYTVNADTSSVEQHGTIVEETSQLSGSYNMGDVAVFSVEADTGYYIKSIKVNGISVDPYNTAEAFEVYGIVTNAGISGGASPAAGEGSDDTDPRITALNFKILNITSNKTVVIEYGVLYYVVKVNTVGVGSVDFTYKTVTYGETVSVTASTVDGYYVYSASVNGNLSVYENAPSSTRREELTNIVYDYSVEFVFKLEKNTVNFSGSGATISYSDDSGNELTYDLPKSILCDYSSNHTFVIQAEEGAYIEEVKVHGIQQDVAFDATVHYLTVDAIDANYDVVIITSARSYSLSVFSNLPDEGSALTYESVIYYGATATITATAPQFYTLSSYTVTPTPAENLAPSVAENVGASTITYTISIYMVTEDTEVLLQFAIEDQDTVSPYDINLYYDATMGTLFTKTGETNFETGANITYCAEPNEGYYLKYLIINGLTVNANNLNQYSLENVEGTQNVKAVFARVDYKLTIIDNGYGLVTANVWTFREGDTVIIRVSAMTGYEVTAFQIGETGGEMTPCPQSVLDAFNNGTLDYEIGADRATGNLTVNVEFTPLQFEMEIGISSVGGSVNKSTGTPLQVQYGEQVLIDIEAADSYFIDTITVNGNTVDPATLSGNPRMNNDINEYIAGTLAFTVVGNVTVDIQFKPNVYGVSIADTIFGSVEVGLYDKPRSDGKSLELHTGTDLYIYMVADRGYHISELIINGEEISGWELDPDQANNNSNLCYVLKSISGNVTVRVSFEINVYDIKTETINASANFQQYDLLASSYGTVRIYGYGKLSDGVTYTGIEYGSSIIFIITPVRSKGYYVSKFTVTWIDPTITEGIQTKTETFTADAENNGRVEFTVNGAVQLVSAEFSKQLFSFDVGIVTQQLNSTYVADSSLTYNFVNPYEPNNESVTVSLVDGKYEYGLTYVVVSDPGVGYSRTAFTVNDLDRISSVRNNKYSGTITTDTVVVATYQIDTHNVALSSNAYTSATNFWKGEFNIYLETPTGDVLLWTPNKLNNDRTVIGLTGKVEIYATYLKVTYNTQLRIELKPFNSVNGKPYDEESVEENGYMVSSFSLGGIAQNYDADAFTNKYYTVTNETSIAADFALHTYGITLTLNTRDSGSAVSALPATVTWGEDTVVTLNLGVGYDLVAVYVNNTIDYVAAEGFLSGSYVFNNIKRETTVHFVLECRPLDIVFSGGYNDVFTVGGENYTSNTGVVFNEGSDSPDGYFAYAYGSYRIIPEDGVITGENGARYNDTITFYFMPVDGYKLSSLSIVMYDLSGNKYLGVDDVSATNLYDEGRGYYKYSLAVSMLGRITINVEYAIKTYKVNVTNVGFGSITSNYAKTVEHHSTVEYIFRANYGYHLSELTINGNVIECDYTKINANGKWYYEYTTSAGGNDLTVNNALINGSATIEIRAIFEVNTFNVRIFVNGIDTNALRPDTTLTPVLPNNSIQYSESATGVIMQTRSEGYSITSITFTNQTNSQTINFNTTGATDNRKLTRFSFNVAGEVMDMLDYHNSNGNVLYIYYTTAIDTHTSVVNSHLYESDKETSDVPTSGGVAAFSLSATYSDGLSGNGTLHNYFTVAEVSFTLTDSDNYEFAGFQEYDSASETWSYLVNGTNGIKLAGTSFEYTIKADRQFRAVVFRVYDVRVEVHPEYKYLSGSINSSTFNMLYRTYIRMTATITYNADKMPNTNNQTAVLPDIDDVSNDGVFVYRVYAFAALNLKGVDTLTGSGMNVSSSVSYYYISSSTSGGVTTLKQTEAALATGAGAVIDSDKLVHAYYVNNTYLSFKVETVGGATGNEGGNILYYFVDRTNGQMTATSPTSGNLRATANSQMRIIITPNSNYDFEAISLYDVLDTPDPSGNKQFNGTWSDLTSDEDGFLKVTKEYAANGKVTRVVVDLIVTENMIFKIQFWKLLEVTSSVALVTDETNDATLIANITPDFTSSVADGTYRYNDTLSFSVPQTIISDTYDITYQFVGFIVNGVNAYKQLSNSYPPSYEVTFTLYDYDATNAPDGIYIVHDGTNYVANIQARYVPVYNIIIENEYYFSEGSYSTYFDAGQISYRTTIYNYEYPLYYSSTTYVNSKTSSSTATDSTIQVMGKVNSSSSSATDVNTAGSGYNSWNDNTITLNWVSGSLTRYTEQYNFIAWQYYVCINGTWQWANISEEYSSSASNKVTAKTFTFPIKALFANSYLTVPGNTSYKQASTVYDASGNVASVKNIYAIRVRPLFERVINVALERQVYYTEYGVVETSHANDNPALILENRSTNGTFGFYETITMTPSVQTGYKFLGWYLESSGDGSKITTAYNNGSGFTATNNYAIGGTSGAETLYVRLTDEDVDSSTNYLRVYARYIKVWTITFMTKNESGTSNLLLTSIPYIKQVYYNDSGSVTGSVERSQMYTATVEAGTKLYYKLYDNASSNFDVTYDKYTRTETSSDGRTIWGNNINDDDYKNSVVPIANSNSSAASVTAYSNSLSNAQYTIFANSNKTVTVFFYSIATLTINNIYYGSTIVIPSVLQKAVGWSSDTVTDGSSRDSDGGVNATITIKDIPIQANVEYDGAFGNILPNTTAALALGGSSVGIKFIGSGITSKVQSFKYYNTSTGSQDSYTQRNVPFQKGLTIDAGTGTASNPYLISSVSELNFINTLYVGNGNDCQYSAGGASILPLNFRVTANINMSAFTTPMCSTGKGFNGVFDGANFSFSAIKLSGSNNLGIFAQTNGATVKNIVLVATSGNSVSATGANAAYVVGEATDTILDNIKMSTSSSVSLSLNCSTCGGIIAGRVKGKTLINNCYVRFPVVRGTSYVGGLVGSIESTSATMTSCEVSNPSITATSSCGGGLVGYAGSSDGTSISGCRVTGSGTSFGTGIYIGGAIGYNAAKVENVHVAVGNVTIRSARATSFTESVAKNNYSSYGGGGLVGYNVGIIRSSGLSGSGTMAFTGSICGGIVGVNAGGTIYDTNTRLYRIEIIRDAYTYGGAFGMHAGYSNGSIEYATTNYASGNNYTYSDAVFFIGNGDYGSTSTSGNTESLDNDSVTIILGGIVGYNAGRLANSYFKGKLYVNRRCGNGTSNKTYIGGLMGINTTSSPTNLINNSVVNAYIRMFLNIWADKSDSPTTIYQYLSDIAGVGGYSGTYNNVSDNAITLDRVANGTYKTNHTEKKIKILFVTYLVWTANAKNYRKAKAEVTFYNKSASISGGDYTTSSIPYELYDDSGKSSAFGGGKYYQYNGYLRQLAQADRKYISL